MCDTLRRDFRAQLTALAAPEVVFEGRVARVHSDGDPLSYPTGPEYRTAEELARIVEQLPGTPVTMLHPDDLVGADPKARIVGTIRSARVDGDHAVATIVVKDLDALDEIRRDMRELSLGYLCQLSGSRQQINTRVDHLALVPRARCGKTCELRVDELVEPAHSSIQVFTDPGTGTWVKPEAFKAGTFTVVAGGGGGGVIVRQGGSGGAGDVVQTQVVNTTDFNATVEIVVGESGAAGVIDAPKVDAEPARRADCSCKSCASCYAADTMEELQKQLTAALADAASQKLRADAAETKLTQTEIAADNARAELATQKSAHDTALAAEKARADAAVVEAEAKAEQIRKDAADAQSAAVNARVALLTSATKVLGEVDYSKSDREIKCAVIKHVDGMDVPAEKPDLYVDGIFDGAVDRHARAGSSRADALKAVVGMRADAVTNPLTMTGEAQAKAALNARMANAWMGNSTGDVDTEN